MSRDPRTDDDVDELVRTMHEIERHLRHAKLAMWSIVAALFLIALPPLMEFLWGVLLFIGIGIGVIALVALIIWGSDKVAERLRDRRRRR